VCDRVRIEPPVEHLDVELTVGTENWFWSQFPPTQNGALPLIALGTRQERARSSE
jgi:hypothetical protein